MRSTSTYALSLLTLASLTLVSSVYGAPTDFQKQDALDAQKSSTQYAILDASSCNRYQQTFIDSDYAKCICGAQETTACAGNTICVVIPLSDKPGTRMMYDILSDALVRVQGAGVSSGLTGSDFNSTSSSKLGATATGSPGQISSSAIPSAPDIPMSVIGSASATTAVPAAFSDSSADVTYIAIGGMSRAWGSAPVPSNLPSPSSGSNPSLGRRRVVAVTDATVAVPSDNLSSMLPSFSTPAFPMTAFPTSAFNISIFPMPSSAFPTPISSVPTFPTVAFNMSAFPSSVFNMSALPTIAFNASAFPTSAFDMSAFPNPTFNISAFPTLTFNGSTLPTSAFSIPSFAFPSATGAPQVSSPFSLPAFSDSSIFALAPTKPVLSSAFPTSMNSLSSA